MHETEIATDSVGNAGVSKKIENKAVENMSLDDIFDKVFECEKIEKVIGEMFSNNKEKELARTTVDELRFLAEEKFETDWAGLAPREAEKQLRNFCYQEAFNAATNAKYKESEKFVTFLRESCSQAENVETNENPVDPELIAESEKAIADLLEFIEARTREAALKIYRGGKSKEERFAADLGKMKNQLHELIEPLLFDKEIYAEPIKDSVDAISRTVKSQALKKLAEFAEMAGKLSAPTIGELFAKTCREQGELIVKFGGEIERGHDLFGEIEELEKTEKINEAQAQELMDIINGDQNLLDIKEEDYTEEILQKIAEVNDKLEEKLKEFLPERGGTAPGSGEDEKMVIKNEEELKQDLQLINTREELAAYLQTLDKLVFKPMAKRPGQYSEGYTKAYLKKLINGLANPKEMSQFWEDIPQLIQEKIKELRRKEAGSNLPSPIVSMIRRLNFMEKDQQKAIREAARNKSLPEFPLENLKINVKAFNLARLTDEERERVLLQIELVEKDLKEYYEKLTRDGSGGKENKRDLFKRAIERLDMSLEKRSASIKKGEQVETQIEPGEFLSTMLDIDFEKFSAEKKEIIRKKCQEISQKLEAELKNYLASVNPTEDIDPTETVTVGNGQNGAEKNGNNKLNESGVYKDSETPDDAKEELLKRKNISTKAEKEKRAELLEKYKREIEILEEAKANFVERMRNQVILINGKDIKKYSQQFIRQSLEKAGGYTAEAIDFISKILVK